MDQNNSHSDPSISRRRLSYKFQRLAEKIRLAIDSGELKGKLPGERVLAKRFNANAKTLSKALTDLAAEGVLDRSIGRGTFVKGTAPAASNGERWLLLCDAKSVDSPLAREILKSHPQTQVSTDNPLEMRPSFINPFSAIIDFSTKPREDFVRDMVVRNIPMVLVGCEPQTYTTHAVVPDTAHGLAKIARELMFAGHRGFAAVEPRGSQVVSQVLRSIASRYAPDARIDSCEPTEIAAMIDHGVTAAICDSPESATIVSDILDTHGIRVPGQMAIAAVGCIAGEPPCSGWFVTAREIAENITQILRDNTSRRPVTIWLTGTFIDVGTTQIHGPVNGHLPSLIGSTAN
jgi:DNA-binding transcriptional regulator YhcF (GntR family)